MPGDDSVVDTATEAGRGREAARYALVESPPLGWRQAIVGYLARHVVDERVDLLGRAIDEQAAFAQPRQRFVRRLTEHLL